MTDAMPDAMPDVLSDVFAKIKERDRVGLMTHVVFGYPTIEATRQIVEVMVEAGVDLIEVQLPFSDPTADGPTISRACQKALDRGVRVREGLDFVKEMSEKHSVPFLFMSYYNVVFNYYDTDTEVRGPAAFARAAAESGAVGLIVPDAPPDELDEGYPEACREQGIHPIYVLSPNMDERRLNMVAGAASGFLYSTSRTGTTGREMELEMDELGQFLHRAREITGLPIAVGFSISKREQLEALYPTADMGVVGSHLIRVYDEQGFSGLEREIRALAGRGD